jgi:DNA excision repair protein ERCC-2
VGEVVQAIGALLEARRGNYLVYFPSYQYLNAVREQFQALYPATRTLVQQPRMSEAEREGFLAAFAAEHRETLAGFAVMGGIFGEGIDLVGERLIGAIIVGVGLPQLCIERDLIRGYFQESRGRGFEYAYTYPGMNRVLQATGRVIRSEADRGAVLLVDARFAEPRYQRLFPKWWRPVKVRDNGQIRAALGKFWDAGLEG